MLRECVTNEPQRTSAGRLDATWLQPKAEDVSAFGQHQRFPLHARKTSGTQGR